MMAAVPACPACGEGVDNADGQMVYHDGESAVCDHCETFLVCEDGAMVVDYEEDHHRLCKEVVRLRETLAEVRADRAYGRWTTKKALALLDDGNVDHARRTLAHAMRLAQPPEVG